MIVEDEDDVTIWGTLSPNLVLVLSEFFLKVTQAHDTHTQNLDKFATVRFI